MTMVCFVPFSLALGQALWRQAASLFLWPIAESWAYSPLLCLLELVHCSLPHGADGEKAIMYLCVYLLVRLQSTPLGQKIFLFHHFDGTPSYAWPWQILGHMFPE